MRRNQKENQFWWLGEKMGVVFDFFMYSIVWKQVGLCTVVKIILCHTLSCTLQYCMEAGWFMYRSYDHSLSSLSCTILYGSGYWLKYSSSDHSISCTCMETGWFM